MLVMLVVRLSWVDCGERKTRLEAALAVIIYTPGLMSLPEFEHRLFVYENMIEARVPFYEQLNRPGIGICPYGILLV